MQLDPVKSPYSLPVDVNRRIDSQAGMAQHGQCGSYSPWLGPLLREGRSEGESRIRLGNRLSVLLTVVCLGKDSSCVAVVVVVFQRLFPRPPE